MRHKITQKNAVILSSMVGALTAIGSFVMLTGMDAALEVMAGSARNEAENVGFDALFMALFVGFMAGCTLYGCLCHEFEDIEDLVGYRGLRYDDVRPRRQAPAPANQQLRIIGQQHQAAQQRLHQILLNQFQQENTRVSVAAAAA